MAISSDLSSQGYWYPVDSKYNSATTPVVTSELEESCWKAFLSKCTPDPFCIWQQSDAEFLVEHHRRDYLSACIQASILLMQLSRLDGDNLTLSFDHYPTDGKTSGHIAKSQLTLACVRRFGAKVLPMEIPPEIRQAIFLLKTVRLGRLPS